MRRWWLGPVPVLLLLLSIGGCGGELPGFGSGSAITPDLFVEAMVRLRSSAMLNSSGHLPEGEPERILMELGLEPDDLRQFVEVHGDDVPMMADVWEEIDRRVNEERVRER